MEEIAENRFEFVYKAIEEVQESNRFLDTKAGLLVVFESSVFVIIIAGIFEQSAITFYRQLLSQLSPGWEILIKGVVILYLLSICLQILYTLRTIFPSEAPHLHVNLGSFSPTELFYQYKLDSNDRMATSVVQFSKQLCEMDRGDILMELTYEFLKLSYIRKKKSDRLRISIQMFSAFIISIAFILVLVTVVF
jgi:hypothetical protein